ncbi:MAG: DUF5060 domain-containing protein [Bacteroidota bacterium]
MTRVLPFFYFILLTFIASCSHDPLSSYQQWHPLTLSFEGPDTEEQAEVNPFTDYRLEVEFRLGAKSYLIRGFYAADGNSAETSAEKGNVWQVKFSPDESGTWTYSASLRKGSMIAISDDPEAGEALELVHATGSFVVRPMAEATGESRDFRLHGRIEKTGRYFRHMGSGRYVMKGGADSPENFLAYADFDGTQRGEGYQAREGENAAEGLHTYRPHVGDWKVGDPTWQDGKGKGMIGALNYLASTGMNSVYFLTMNIKGDGEDVWPYTNYSERMRFDCSKLAQWDMVFSHMESLGLMMHVVTQETENERLLDDGDTGPERQLYYRELIARFGHHLGLVWNLGEENGPANFSPDGQTAEQQKAMATYLKTHDPYNHPIVIHTHSTPPSKDEILTDLLGHPELDGLSLQINHREDVYPEIRKWRSLSAQANHEWLMGMDEIGQWHTGVMPDAINPNHDTIRQQVLWGSLMAGAAGVEWYFGARYEGNDLACEDWRSRENMWDQTRFAIDLFDEIPYWEMEAMDELMEPKGPWLFGHPRKGIYLIYFVEWGNYTIQLPTALGRYEELWYNPRTGKKYPGQEANLNDRNGTISVSAPPEDPQKDWALLIQYKEKE